MSIEIPDELLNEALRVRAMSWADDDDKTALTGSLRRGMTYIHDKTGVPFTSFYGDDADERARSLLFSWLLYDAAGSLDDFARNYGPEIISLRMKYEVKDYDSTETEDSDVS